MPTWLATRGSGVRCGHTAPGCGLALSGAFEAKLYRHTIHKCWARNGLVLFSIIPVATAGPRSSSAGRPLLPCVRLRKSNRVWRLLGVTQRLEGSWYSRRPWNRADLKVRFQAPGTVLMSPWPLAKASSPSSARVSLLGGGSQSMRVGVVWAQHRVSPRQREWGASPRTERDKAGLGEMSSHSCPVQVQTCRGPDIRPRHREQRGVSRACQVTWNTAVSRPTATLRPLGARAAEGWLLSRCFQLCTHVPA